MLQELQQRAAVVAEARSWLRTPYSSHAKLKGIGADCGTFLAAVYANAGVFVAKDLPDLPPQWFMHSDREWYLEYLAKYAVEYKLAPSGVALASTPAIPARAAVLAERAAVDGPTTAGLEASATQPQPGDIICAKHGRAFSHGAIVTAWPHALHCFPPCVMESSILYNPVYAGRQMKFFNPWKKAISNQPSAVSQNGRCSS